MRLSPEARQQLIDEERDVRVAESNVDAARVAEGEAKQFASIVDSERKAAKARVEAAKKGKALGASAGAAGQADAPAKHESAQMHAATVEAKAEYAKELLAYRTAVLEQRKAEIAAARAELERVKVDRLTAENQAAGLDRAAFERAAVSARKHAGDLRGKAESRRSAAEQRQHSWQSMHSSDMARGETDNSTVDAPAPPSALESPATIR